MTRAGSVAAWRAVSLACAVAALAPLAGCGGAPPPRERRPDARPASRPSDKEFEGSLFGGKRAAEGTEEAAEGGQSPPSVWEEARRAGVDFRAAGNEPGWWLEIRDSDHIVLAADYGEKNVELPAPEPRRDSANGRTIYQVSDGGHDLEIAIEAKPCHDVMSGEPFEAAVRVTLDGQVYDGCGRSLR